MKKQILLIGGRSKAKSLALSLIRKGYQVTAINRSEEDCHLLAQIDKLTVIHGDGTRPYILEEAGISPQYIVIAMTPKDEDNLVICELCKRKHNVLRTIALVSDPRKTDFFYKMGIDSVVCAISAVTNILEQQAFMDEITKVIPIGEGRVQIAEVPISASAPTVGKKLLEIDLPKDVIIGCILRGDMTMIPRGDTRILSGDLLVVISGNGQELAAIRALTGGRSDDSKH